MAQFIVSTAEPSRGHIRLIACLFVVLFARSAWTQAAPAPPPPPPPPKDVLVFTNGDQLTGTLERSQDGNVVFRSDMAGEVTVPFAKVKELHTQGDFAVLRQKETPKTAHNEQPGKISLSGDSLTLANPSAGTVATVPVKDVQYLIDVATYNKELNRKENLWNGWGGSVNFGTSFTQSFSHGGSVTGGAALVRQIPDLNFFPTRNRTTANFQENFGVLTSPELNPDGTITKDGNGNNVIVQVKTSIMHADAERDEYISPRFYVLAVTSFDHNYSQSLDLQQIYGGGFGWTPLKSGLQQLDLKVDGHYEKQQFFDRTLDLNLFGSTFAENYRRNLPLKMTLTQTLAVLPAWTDLHAYSANGSVAVLAPVFRRLSLNLTATDSYLNNPVPGFLKNSFTFTTGLTYSLR